MNQHQKEAYESLLKLYISLDSAFQMASECSTTLKTVSEQITQTDGEDDGSENMYLALRDARTDVEAIQESILHQTQIISVAKNKLAKVISTFNKA